MNGNPFRNRSQGFGAADALVPRRAPSVRRPTPDLYAAVATLPCQYPGCGAHGVQVAHSNQLRDGKGRGMKSYPWRVAALCPAHHVAIDSGIHLTKEQRRELWDEAHRATVGELFRLGLIGPL